MALDVLTSNQRHGAGSVLALACAASSIFAGCRPAGPEVIPVSGVVLFKGAPLAKANVTFSSDEMRQATGLTDARGQFKLTTFEPGDGALPGNYKVVVTMATMGDNDMIFVPKPDYLKKRSELPIPPRYASPATTPLAFEVARGKPKSFTIELQE
jgi:hypothetical protein